MNNIALPGERLAPLGTPAVPCSEPQLQPVRGPPGSKPLRGPLSPQVNAFVWRDPVGVELGPVGPKSCLPRKSNMTLRS